MLIYAGILPPTEFGPHVRVHNLLRPLPYADGSVACIYAGEVWEHFEYADALTVTKDCYRVLAPGGVLRVCVPDGPALWRRYLDTFDAMMSLPPHEREAQPIRDIVQMFFNDICTRRIWFGSMGHTHKWQWDEIQLIELFQQTGFKAVERRDFHNSRITDIASFERANFLIVEGVK